MRPAPFKLAVTVALWVSLAAAVTVTIWDSLASFPAYDGGSNVSTPAPTSVPSTPAPPDPAPTEYSIDPALVGTCIGTLDGNFGPARFTMTLASSGTVRTDNSGSYCGFTGTWYMDDGLFDAQGRDCTGTLVLFGASVSGSTLSGAWGAENGRYGTFTCTKQ